MIFDPSNEAGHSFVGAGALVVNGTIFSGNPDAVFSNGNTPDTGRFESNGIVIVGSMQVNRAASNLRFDPPGAVTIPDGSPEGAVRLIK